MLLKLGLKEDKIHRVGHVTTHAGIGGAGKAARRIVQAQLSLRMESTLHCLAADQLFRQQVHVPTAREKSYNWLNGS